MQLLCCRPGLGRRVRAWSRHAEWLGFQTETPDEADAARSACPRQLSARLQALMAPTRTAAGAGSVWRLLTGAGLGAAGAESKPKGSAGPVVAAGFASAAAGSSAYRSCGSRENSVSNPACRANRKDDIEALNMHELNACALQEIWKTWHITPLRLAFEAGIALGF